MSFLQTLNFHCFQWLKEKNSTWKSLTINQVRVNVLYGDTVFVHLIRVFCDFFRWRYSDDKSFLGWWTARCCLATVLVVVKQPLWRWLIQKTYTLQKNQMHKINRTQFLKYKKFVFWWQDRILRFSRGNCLFWISKDTISLRNSYLWFF